MEIFFRIHKFFGCRSGNCFYSAHSGGNGTFGIDLEQAYAAGGLSMTAAAEFYAVAEFDNSYLVAVFFAEKCDGS